MTINSLKRNYSAGILLIGGIINKFIMVFVDIFLASIFGASPDIAIFMIAFRVFQIIRRIFNESGLQMICLIPLIQTIKEKSPENAANFFMCIFFKIIIWQAVSIMVLEGLIKLILQYSIISDDTALLLNYSSIFLLSIPFIVFFTLQSSMLQSENKFFIVSASHLIFNISAILVSFFLFVKNKNISCSEIAWIIVFSSFLQSMSLMVPSWNVLKAISGASKGTVIKTMQHINIGRNVMFGIIGIGTVQINSLIDMIFCKFSGPSGPAHMWYASRLVIPMATIVGVSIASSIIANITTHYNNKNDNIADRLIEKVYRKSMFVTLPATGFIFSVCLPLISVMFFRGKFTKYDMYFTALCVWMLVISVPSSVAVRILYTKYFASRNNLIPTISSVFSVLINIILNSIFIFGFRFGTSSIALATSISTILQHIMMYSKFKLDSKHTSEDKHNPKLFSVFLITILSSIITIILSNFFVGDNTLNLLIRSRYIQPEDLYITSRLAGFLSISAIYWLFFITLAYLMGILSTIYYVIESIFNKKIKSYANKNAYDLVTNPEKYD